MTDEERLDAHKKVRELFADDTQWTQGVYARRTHEASPVQPHNISLSGLKDQPQLYSCFCLAGGYYRVFGSNAIAVDQCALDHGFRSEAEMIDWNDRPDRSPDQVRALLDRTITRMGGVEISA